MKTRSLLLLSLAICLGSGCESIQKTIDDLAKPASPPKPSPVKPPAQAEAKATLGDLKSFWTVISGYDYMSVPSIRVELIFLSNKTKLNVFTDNNLKSPLPNITKLELYVLRIKIEKECPKIEPKKRFAYLKLIYVNGDAPDVSVSMSKPDVLPEPVVLEKTDSKIFRIPCGLHVAEIKARFKESETRLVPAFLEDDTFIVFIKTTGPDRIFANEVKNVLNLKNSTCGLFVFSLKDVASFQLESPLLLARPQDDDKSIDPFDKANLLDLKALANSYPAMKNYLDLKRVKILTPVGIIPMKLVEAKNGASVLELPAPIFLKIPAGEYKINGKIVIIDKPFHKLDLDQP